ncbi:MAG: DNA-binding protein, partial [Actinobacteria bacterium]|nr:DNA-binding protein [Actinomycetota bacterium]NCA26139.1 DNA-binding protein [Actinomycetota bacterium]
MNTNNPAQRLRDIRKSKGWSLQDVEHHSNGKWKAVVIGSYERG